MKNLLIVANVSKEHIRKFHIPFIQKMKESGWQVDVACRMDVPVPECDHAFDLPCDRNPFRGGLFRSVRLLRQLIRENGYDVIHCHTITGCIIARIAGAPFRKKGLKVFYTCHGMHFFRGASFSRWLFGYPMEKCLAPFTDVLITINEDDEQMAHKHLSACGAIERIHGIGVHLSRFTEYHSDTAPAQFRKSLGLAPDDFVMIYVAEINQNKNQYALLEAFARIRQTIHSAKLLLVGPDHDNGKLQEMIHQRGFAESVLLLGWRSDIPQLLHCADMYVASSKSEGLPLNLIEAMACDLPVVAFRNRGHCSIIDHGHNGFIVPQGDSNAMAEQVIRLHQDPALKKQIVAQAQKDIRQYDTEHVLNELTSIYNKYL